MAYDVGNPGPIFGQAQKFGLLYNIEHIVSNILNSDSKINLPYSRHGQ